MGPSKDAGAPDQNPKEAREPQPYTREIDMQRLGEQVTHRAQKPIAGMDDELLGAHGSFTYDPEGKTHLDGRVRVGGGEITPMKIAAIISIASIAIIIGGIIMVIRDYPPIWGFGSFALFAALEVSAVYLARYESSTRRKAIEADLERMRTPITDVNNIVDLDTKNEPVVLPTIIAQPKALDGKEPVQ